MWVGELQGDRFTEICRSWPRAAHLGPLAYGGLEDEHAEAPDQAQALAHRDEHVGPHQAMHGGAMTRASAPRMLGALMHRHAGW